ncbi:MAG: methyltransferase domain-containing protein [Verrucomicrobiota bacterium]
MERRLHIGGTQSAEGWEVLNIEPASYVDHVGNATDLSRFPDETFSVLYGSHILEHMDYLREVESALKEWRRVLIPGGMICLSVPDLEILGSLLLLKDRFDVNDRYLLMRMIYGGHNTPNDYHYAGFTEDLLQVYLMKCEFQKIERVQGFPFFEDTSRQLFKGLPISLNMQAIK